MAEIAPAPGAARPRPLLIEDLITCGAEGRPRAVLVHGPRGWGKREILEEAIEGIRVLGTAAAAIDLARCCTSPDEFATSFAGACLEAAGRPAAREGADHDGPPGPPRTAGIPTPGARLRALAASRAAQDLPSASGLIADLLAELARRRGRGRAVFDLAMQIPGAVADDLGAPLALVGHGLDEVGRLVHVPGLEEVHARFASALARSASVRLLASIAPAGRPREMIEALFSAFGQQIEVRVPPSLTSDEIVPRLGGEGAAETARTLLAITGGRPLTTSILAARIGAGLPLADALSEGMEPEGGRLHQELRFDYHLLIERTRGHAASRAILHLVAREEGLDLSGIASRLRRSAGSTLDYLRWLLEVDLLRRDGRRYRFADPLMRLHILLHEIAERPADTGGRRTTIERFLARLHDDPIPLRPLGRPRGRRARPAAAEAVHAPNAPGSPEAPAAPEPPPSGSPRREDSLIEID